MRNIYLDYAATTPVHPQVVQAMLPYYTEIFGNPSSVHRAGQKAEDAIETARETIAQLIGCQPHEIIFTSGGSESDNLALRGTALAAKADRDARHVLISPVEHHAILHTAGQLASLFGFEVELLPVDEFGRVDPADIDRLIRPDTAVVSVMHANNEVGTINPIDEIGAVCRQHGVPFHSDAVQGAAHLPIDVDALHVDLLSIGGHKLYGPKGVGVLYISAGTRLLPALTGGSQEFGLRAGTQNVPQIVGMAEAYKITRANLEQHAAHLRAWRDQMIGTVLEQIPDAKLTGHPRERLPNHASFAFRDVEANQLLMLLDTEGFACSAGSACKTGNPEPSEVLTTLGLPPTWGLGSLRVTLGWNTTPEEVKSFLAVLPRLVEQSRKIYRE